MNNYIITILTSSCHNYLVAVAVNELEANERKQESLVWSRSYYRGLENVFAERKELWFR